MTFPAQPPGTPPERIAGVQPQERNYYYAYRDTATVVVFVHGIFSNPRFCWLNPRREGAYWPEIVYTDREIVDVSIFLAGYHTGLFVRNYGISDCASELFIGLQARQQDRRAPLDHREIIFVCHSAGGVIVRHLLTQYTASFASKRVLLALYASPSRGSIYPRWLTPIFYVLRQRLGLELSVGNPILRELDKRFKYLQHELAERGRNPRERRKTLELHGFEAHELQPPAPLSWLSGALSVVTPESADSYFDFHAIPRSDHVTVVKPEDDKALSHQYLKRAITRLGPLPSIEHDDDDPPVDFVPEPVWRHQATGMLGAPWLRQVMARERSPNYLCVDEGVLLWSRNDYGNTLPDQLAVELRGIPGYPERLDKPSPSEIIDVLNRHEHLPGIREWLMGQIDASRPTAADTRQDGTKAGVVALLPPTKAVNQTPALIVIEPLSFWLIRRFNRLILDQDSRPLKALRDQCLKSLLSRQEALHFAFPSALYVELVLTVADDSVVVLRKSHTLSPAARSGRSYTSGIEEGFGWPDVQGNGSNFSRIALLGLKRELGVVEAEVDLIEFFGVALEASHLNVGVLGHAHLRIGQEELRARLRDSDDYDDSLSFIDVARMDERLADRAPRSPWHPTARLRMLLLEYRRRGQAVVDAAIRRIIDSPSPN